MSKGKHASGKSVARFFIVLAALVLALLLAAFLIFDHYYKKMNYDPGLSDAEKEQAIASFDESQLPDEGEPPADYVPPTPDVVLNDEAADNLKDELDAELSDTSDATVDREITNILFIGTDARSTTEKSRSDSMILVSLNRKTGEINMVSFMRDIYAKLPGHGYNRLNVAHAIAGPAYTVETIETDFGVEIDNYLEVNFFVFIDMIDAIQGIDLEITKEEAKYINFYLLEQNEILGNPKGYDNIPEEAGMVHLNGNQALGYCRIRYVGGDQGRTARQRTVLALLFERAKHAPVSQLNDLVDAFLPQVTTDLTRTDCLNLVKDSPEILSYTLNAFRIPEDGTFEYADIDGMSVVKISFAQAQKRLQEILYGAE